MFKNLTNFGYQRSAKEAFGFYLAYLVLVMIVSGVLGGTLEVVMQNNTLDFGFRMGIVIAVIFSSGISFLILKEKRLLGNFGFILLALLSGLLTLFSGCLGGLIPAAYLTTRPASGK